MIAQATSVSSGTSIAGAPPGATRPSTPRSCVADFAKKMISSEFQPMIDTDCSAAGTAQPREPNCGFELAIESTPKRADAGPAARSTSSMPIMQPAVSDRAPS